MTTEVKSTLRIVNQADVPGRRAVTDGQLYQRLVGWPGSVDTDRVLVGRATFQPGTYEQLHWHPIEACYYVISGHATVRNFENEEFEVGPGCLIYAPAGIAGAHEWEVKEDQALVHRPRRSRLPRRDQLQVPLLDCGLWATFEHWRVKCPS
jgi:quercetin dioxygenase-like cupin family protein